MGKYEPLPGLVSIPSVTPQMLGHLYQLAAQFYQATPGGGSMIIIPSPSRVHLRTHHAMPW
jgi:hypothetical protein